MPTSTIIILALFVIVFILLIPTIGKSKNFRNAGYEFLTDTLWMKDGNLFYIPSTNLSKAVPVDVVGVSEIRSGSKLSGLEIRFRIDGSIKLARVSGLADRLLTIEDKLGYAD